MTTFGVMRRGTASIERLGASACAVCADLAASAFESTEREADAWLEGVAARIARETARSCITWLSIVQPVGGAGDWELCHFGVAGEMRPELAAALRREARDGFPHDDVATHAGHREQNPRATSGPRRRFLGDDQWFRSGYAAFRRPLGLHEFTRAVVPFWEMEEPRTLLVQIDLLRSDAAPEEQEVEIVSSLTPIIARAYHHRFVSLREHQESVRRKLTPAQRRILPYLVEGLSEPQIGEAVERSAHTIHDHTKTIYSTLNVSNRRELRDLWFGRREPKKGEGSDGAKDPTGRC